jgi:DNA-binding MarR family transcriptional regulator
MTNSVVRTDELAGRLAVGLLRLAAALDAATTGHASGQPHTLTEQQMLLVLTRLDGPCSVEELASRLAMSTTAVVSTLGRLREDGLLTMDPAPSYGLDQMSVALTDRGRSLPPPLLNWAGQLLGSLAGAPDSEQERLLELVVERISMLQRRGRLPVARMCLTCRFFQPYAHAGQPDPHHCALVDAAFGHPALRVHCPEQQPPPAPHSR